MAAATGAWHEQPDHDLLIIDIGTAKFDPGNMPVITAGSSLAAEMLAEAAPEIRKMGFGLDLESNAANIPVLINKSGVHQPLHRNL